MNQLNNNLTVTGLPSGTYNWSVNCTDHFNNSNVSLVQYFVVDLTLPSISLLYPKDGHNTSQTTINFNFTGTDNLDGQLDCNLTLDGTVQNSQDISLYNGSYANYTVTSLSAGSHYWNVTCRDNSSNLNTSATYSFRIDYTAPTVALESPGDSTWDGDGSVQMSYIPTDLYVKECVLWGDFSGAWAKNLTDSDPTHAVTNSFDTIPLGDGTDQAT